MTRRLIRRAACVSIAVCVVVMAFALTLRLLGLTTPVTRANVERIREGMTRAEVEAILGGPGQREPWDNQAGSTWMSWWLQSPADVDAFYLHATRAGVVAPWPPSDMPWNVRECHIRHPDGHTFRVGARLSDE